MGGGGYKSKKGLVFEMTKPGFFIKARRALEVMGQADEASFKGVLQQSKISHSRRKLEYDYGDECCF